MRIPRGATAVLAAVGAVGVVVAVRAGPPAEAATRPPAVRALTATGTQLAFDKATLRAPAGPVRLAFTNRSDLAHNVAIRGGKLARPRLGKIVGRGGVSRVTVTLPPGRYTYYCSVFGHEAGGMAGTLVVPRPRS